MKLRKHTLNLREGDWDAIERVYAPRGIPTAVVIRQVISRLVDRVLSDGITEDDLKSIKEEL